MRDLTGGTVLAVDDEPANLDLLERILADHDPVRVHRVNDPRHALERFQQLRPDLVLLDVNMPHLDGFAVMQQLQDAVPEDRYVPILIMTANVDPGTRRQALAMGAHDFVTKPFDPAEVRLRVQNFLRTRQLHVQLERQKEMLEERVADRTRDLERANERLLAADQLKTDFLAMVSHEMRTPLTVVKGFTEMITHRWDQLGPEKRELHAEAIARNLTRLETMIVNLLLAAELETFDGTTLSTPSRPTTSEVRVATLIRQAIRDSMLAPAAVIVDCSTDATVNVNPRLMQPVITNLLDNAHKYGEPPVEVHCTLNDDHVVIGVRDHGQGVPEEFTDRMFERFTQASVGDRRTATGSGLGLWIARRLADTHGAELTYRPASPGAHFLIRVPRGKQVEPRRDSTLGSTSHPSSQRLPHPPGQQRAAP